MMSCEGSLVVAFKRRYIKPHIEWMNIEVYTDNVSLQANDL